MPKAILTKEVFELRRQGWSLGRIARKFGVTSVGVTNFLRREAPELRGRLAGNKPVGPCEICGVVGPLDADHAHVEGDRSCRGLQRGLLCRGCNQGLGNFLDSQASLLAAAAYLARTS